MLWSNHLPNNDDGDHYRYQDAYNTNKLTVFDRLKHNIYGMCIDFIIPNIVYTIVQPGLEVIKLALFLTFVLKLKIKRNDWLLVDTFYFEFETILKLYNFEARDIFSVLSKCVNFI